MDKLSDTFRLVIRTPEQEILDRQVASVYLTTELGDMMIMPDYAAFAGSITYSPIILQFDSKEEEYLATNGVVFFSFEKNEAHILCQRMDLRDKVDYDGLHSYLKLVEEQIARGEEISQIHMQFLENQKVALVEQIEAKSTK